MRLLDKVSLAIGALAVAGLIFGLTWMCPRGQESVEDVRQKEAIVVADTARRVAEAKVPVARRKTDRAIADTTANRQQIKTAVVEERTAVDSTLKAADRQIKARDTRINTLEKRSGGILFLYSEVGASSRLDKLQLEFEGEAGLEARLDRNTRIQLGVTTDETVQLKVRRDLKLF